MSYSGTYSDRMRHKVHSTAKNPQTGQEELRFEDGNLIWASIEINSGRKQRDYGADETGVSATISIRNYYPVKAQDRLYAVEWDELWVVETVRRGDNEMICDCYRYDTLNI